METKFEQLIEKYKESQKIFLRNLDNTLVFYIAQYFNDKSLMEHVLEKGVRHNFPNDVIDTVLYAFENE